MQTVSKQTPNGTQQIPVAANCVSVCPPKKDMLTPGRFVVNDIDMMEAITQPLYDYQAYAAAGQTQLTFFQTPTGAGAVNLEGTNMQLAGQLPAPQKYLIQGIGVDFLSGNAAARFGAQSANSNFNDAWAVLRRGTLSLSIGSKEYLRVPNLMNLPVRAHMGGVLSASDQTTPGATMQYVATSGYADGDVFRPTPLLLEAGQNFNVQITWPSGVVAIPSADATARIGVIFYGTLYRPPQ